MIPRAQGLRSSVRSLKTPRTPTAALRGSRNYSAVALQGSRTAGRSFSPQLITSLYSAQQCRSISWTGWWSGKQSTPAESIPIQDDTSPVITSEGATSVKASHATADTPDPSFITAEPEKVPALENLQEHLFAPQDGLQDIDPAAVVERIGFMKHDLGLDFGWGPSSMMQWLLEHLHITLGLPWAVSILILGVGVRAVLVRPIIASQKQGEKMKELKPIMGPLREKYKEAVAEGNKREMTALAAQMRAANSTVGFSAIKAFGPILLQIPLTFGGFRSLRNAAELPVPSFESESFLWFSDLIVGDPWLLPIIVSALTYRAISRNMKYQQPDPQMAGMFRFLRIGMPLASLVFCHYQPLAVQLWFLTTSTMAWVQGESFGNDRVRKMVGLGSIQGMFAKTAPPSEPVDAFGYKFQSREVGGMKISNRNDVIETSARQVSETSPAPAPEQKISMIDKAVNNVKKNFGIEESAKAAVAKREKKIKQKEVNARKMEANDYEREHRPHR